MAEPDAIGHTLTRALGWLNHIRPPKIRTVLEACNTLVESSIEKNAAIWP